MSMWCGPDGLVGVFLLIALFQIIYFCGLSAEALNQVRHKIAYTTAGFSALSHCIVI